MTVLDSAFDMDLAEESRLVLNAAATEAGRLADELIGTGPLPGTPEWDAEQQTEIPAQRSLAWQLVCLRIQFGAGLDCVETVLVLRTMGVSWATIGRALGMTRQSAHERWGERVHAVLGG